MKLLVGTKEVNVKVVSRANGSLELQIAPTGEAERVACLVQDQQQKPYLVGSEHPSTANSLQTITIPVDELKHIANECCAALSAITGLDVCIAYREPVSSDQPENNPITGGSHERKAIYYRGD